MCTVSWRETKRQRNCNDGSREQTASSFHWMRSYSVIAWICSEASQTSVSIWSFHHLHTISERKYESKRALEVYLGEQREVLSECVRVLKQTGSIFWQVGAFSDRGMLVPLDIRLFPMLESFGMIPRNRIVWIRQHGLHGRRKFSCRHETISLVHKIRRLRFQPWTRFGCHRNGRTRSDLPPVKSTSACERIQPGL